MMDVTENQKETGQDLMISALMPLESNLFQDLTRFEFLECNKTVLPTLW